MMCFTHAVIGLLLGEVLLLNTGLVVLGAIIPDIDVLIGVPHRTITHSLLFLIIASLIALKLRGRKAGFSLFLGIASHLMLDSINPMGLQFLWPLPLFYSFDLVYSLDTMPNLLIMGLCLVAYINRESIINFLTGLRKGRAFKGTLLIITGWSALLIFNPVITKGVSTNIGSLVDGEFKNGAPVIINGTICSELSDYTSRSGNDYKVFYVCDGNERIKVFSGAWLINDELLINDSVMISGEYSTDYSEPEITYINEIQKLF